MLSKELMIGRAGEYLVLCDLLINGIEAYDTGQGVKYDVVADVNGKLVRIQVKTTSKKQAYPNERSKNPNPVYFFHLKRAGKGGIRKYGDNDFDYYALVCIEDKKVMYIPYGSVGTNSVSIRSSEIDYSIGKRNNGKNSGFVDKDLLINNFIENA